jgi:hypothetical protein
MTRTIFIATLLLALTAPAFGQGTAQSVQGLVTDTSGGIVPGATVTLTNVGTSVARTTTTNEAGNYSFIAVQVGNYELKVEMTGFKTETVKNIRVETEAQVRQDFKLQVGQVSETVEVTASAVTLNTENATTGGVIENKRVIDLPLNGRNVVNLAVLVPGVQYGIRTGSADGLGGFPIPGSGFAVIANGQREIHQFVSLDGTDAKDPRIHQTNFVPSIEAIEEFKIQTNAFSAEYGFAGGAHTTITMKSGTNRLRGTLFEFLRNDVFDAENYFLNFELAPGQTRRKKDALRRNQFGLVLSGPVLIPKLYDGKNKTFWAFNWESRRDRIEAVSEVWWPDDAFRAGDFSRVARGNVTASGAFRAPIIIYDPLTGQPFPNNIIPTSRLHPGVQKLLSTYVPKPEFSPVDPLDINVRKGVNQPVDTNTYFFRLDHNFGAKDSVFGRLAWDRSGLTRNNINPNLPVFVDSKVTNLASAWIHTFNPSMINEFRMGFNISDDLTFNPRTDNTSFDMDALGIGQIRVFSDGNRKLTPREHGIPQITGLPFTLQELTNGNGYDNMDTIQAGDHFTWIRGRHNLKLGFELYRISMERGAANLEEGRYAFSGNESGNAFASFLMGYANTTESAEGLPLTFPRSNRWGTYVHDDWKVSKNLTVNVGLRFDYVDVPVDSKGLWRTLNFPGVGTEIGRGKGYQASDGATISTVYPDFVDERGAVELFGQRTRFFMPRLGIAWRPTNKWVVRAGAGWFDNINHLNSWTIFNLMPPKSGSLLYQSNTSIAQTLTVVGSNGTTYSPTTRQFTAGQPIITLNDPFLQTTGGTATVRAINLNYLPPDQVDGDVWKWSLDIQRELPYQIGFVAGYSGSKGSHLGNSIANFNSPDPSSNTNVQARRPYQRFYDPATPNLGVQTIGRIRYLDSFGESFYHGLQLKLDKRFSKGLAFGSSYTFSKAHGDGENGGQEGYISLQTPRDRRPSRGRFSFDQTHAWVTHFVWELPGQKLQNALLRYTIGGWQSNGILSIRSGFPFTIGQGQDLNTDNSNVRPDLLRSPEIDNPTRKLWFDPSAFQRVSCNIAARQDLCHYGNNGVNTIDSPGQRNLDFSMFKNFNINENTRIQFRSEFINAFNHPYFGTPGGIGFSGTNVIAPDATRMGEIRSIRTPMRVIQFGLKLYF